jgi:Ca2+-binding EF-hand superfamily protein
MKTLGILALALLASSPVISFAQEKDRDTPNRGGERGDRPRGDRPRGERPEGDRERDRGPEGRPGLGFGDGPRGGEFMGQMLRMLPLMRALDTDGNGELSVSEIENASKSIVKLDKNGDGKVSADEMKPDMAGMPFPPGGGRPDEGGPRPDGEMMTKMFEARDANKDGKLSGDEIPERLQNMLGRLDSNKDGAITKDELTQMSGLMDRLRGGREGREGRGGDEGPVKPKRP